MESFSGSGKRTNNNKMLIIKGTCLKCAMHIGVRIVRLGSKWDWLATLATAIWAAIVVFSVWKAYYS
jgi:hypothetical protein